MPGTLNYKGYDIYIMDGVYFENHEPTAGCVAFYTGLIKSMDKIKAFAAESFLTLYNEDWLDEAIGKLNKKGFMKRLAHPRITLFDAPGKAIIFFDDSDMFAGHSIEVVIENGKPVSTGMVD